MTEGQEAIEVRATGELSRLELNSVVWREALGEPAHFELAATTRGAPLRPAACLGQVVVLRFLTSAGPR